MAGDATLSAALLARSALEAPAASAFFEEFFVADNLADDCFLANAVNGDFAGVFASDADFVLELDFDAVLKPLGTTAGFDFDGDFVGVRGFDCGMKFALDFDGVNGSPFAIGSQILKM